MAAESAGAPPSARLVGDGRFSSHFRAMQQTNEDVDVDPYGSKVGL